MAYLATGTAECVELAQVAQCAAHCLSCLFSRLFVVAAAIYAPSIRRRVHLFSFTQCHSCCLCATHATARGHQCPRLVCRDVFFVNCSHSLARLGRPTDWLATKNCTQHPSTNRGF